jgi:hypothetical protein
MQTEQTSEMNVTRRQIESNYLMSLEELELRDKILYMMIKEIEINPDLANDFLKPTLFPCVHPSSKQSNTLNSLRSS